MPSFPTTVPALANPTGADTLNSGTAALKHATQHSVANDEIEAIATYLIGGTLQCCRVYNSGNISIADSTETALTFDTELFDTADMHSTSATTSRILATVGGVFLLFASVAFASNATGRRSISLRLNGSSYIASQSIAAINGDRTYLAVATAYKLLSTDYAEVTVYQTSTGALNVEATSGHGVQFGMVRLSG